MRQKLLFLRYLHSYITSWIIEMKRKMITFGILITCKRQEKSKTIWFHGISVWKMMGRCVKKYGSKVVTGLDIDENVSSNEYGSVAGTQS